MKDQNNKNRSFIKETITGKQIKKKTVAIWLAIVVCFAVIAGFIAAFVFVKALPLAQKAVGTVKEEPRVTIPPDEDPSAVDIEEKEEPAPEPTSEPEVEKEIEKEIEFVPAEITIDEYLNVQKEMVSVANEVSKSLVTVTAIKSQVDYFNEIVENKQQIKGLIVAKNEENYYILCEAGIFNKVERIQVTFFDGNTADAIFQMEEPKTKLAIVKVSLDNVPSETKNKVSEAILGNSYGLFPGDFCIAVGSFDGSTDSVALGNITSTDSIISVVDEQFTLITTNMFGGPNYSGALINVKGEVIGFTDQMFGDEMIITALPISQLKPLIEKLSNGEKSPYIGIIGSEVSAYISDLTGTPKGVLVGEVIEESPAFFAGFEPYDVIFQIGEDKVANMTQYRNALLKCEANQNVDILAFRKGSEGFVEVSFSVKIGEIG